MKSNLKRFWAIASKAMDGYATTYFIGMTMLAPVLGVLIYFYPIDLSSITRTEPMRLIYMCVSVVIYILGGIQFLSEWKKGSK
tara:strand:- start:15586 stop:15834 length:249 start_codon:yes stop_codon:yes gene_type:complete